VPIHPCMLGKNYTTSVLNNLQFTVEGCCQKKAEGKRQTAEGKRRKKNTVPFLASGVETDGLICHICNFYLLVPSALCLLLVTSLLLSVFLQQDLCLCLEYPDLGQKHHK
jgi:hypothetical protein